MVASTFTRLLLQQHGSAILERQRSLLFRLIQDTQVKLKLFRVEKVKYLCCYAGKATKCHLSKDSPTSCVFEGCMVKALLFL